MKSLVRQLTPDLNRSVRSLTAGCNGRVSCERSTRPLTRRRLARWPVLNLTKSLLRSRFVPTITLPGITNALSVNQSYGYDTLDRLTQFSAGYPGATTPATGQGFLPAEAFTYDAIGNRLTRTATPPGGSASTATYAYPNTSATPAPNRNHTLASIAGAQTNAYTYDATGNTNTESAALGTSPNPTNGTQLTQTYDAKNRLKITQIGTTATDTVTYKINALGQRVQKTGAGTYVYSTSTTIDATTGLSPQAASIPFNARYVYDEQGRLLGEYSPEGKLIAETIWFDDLPVATLRPKGSSVQLPLGIAGTGTATANNAGNNTPANPVNVDVFYLHPDHLGTPRAMTRSVAANNATSGPDAINKATWRWESDPFGTSIDNSKPNENPQNVTGTASQITAASFRVINRFPGQVFDAESAKSYNYFRDYDPSIGRYVESDPIGLRGGASTYGYVSQRPMRHRDPRGLIKWEGFFGGASAAFFLGGGNYYFDLKSECKCGIRARAQGYASGVGGGLGLELPRVPVSGSGGGQDFHDSRSCPDPNVFNGFFSIGGVSVIGGYGYSCGGIILGGAIAYGSAFGCSDGYGIDIGVTAFAGAAYVFASSVEKCGGCQ